MSNKITNILFAIKDIFQKIQKLCCLNPIPTGGRGRGFKATPDEKFADIDFIFGDFS